MNDDEREMAERWCEAWVSDHPDYRAAKQKWLDAQGAAKAFAPKFDENVTAYVQENAARLADLKRVEADAHKAFEDTRKSLTHKYATQTGIGVEPRAPKSSF